MEVTHSAGCSDLGFSALRINLANRLSRSNKRQIDNSPELKHPEICSGSNESTCFLLEPGRHSS